MYRLDSLLDGVRDSRQNARVSMGLVARIMLVLGTLRIRSFNALEPKLAEAGMQRAIGAPLSPGTRACSADTLSYALNRSDPDTARAALVALVKHAERNKVFREGWHGAMRFVAIDGWEPHSSYERHCPACLTRQVTVKSREETATVTQYYHAYVVALLVNERMDVVIDMEPIRSADVRVDAGEPDVKGHEGELTAAKRLVPRLRETYGGWLDVLVVDALYGNGPFLSVAKQVGFGVIAVIKKKTDEPLKEALAIWSDSPPSRSHDNPHTH
ncbi:MAG: hypothetical protein AAB295_07235, partial [Chloroflexota bacterium]